jgi:hypothetical protein
MSFELEFELKFCTYNFVDEKKQTASWWGEFPVSRSVSPGDIFAGFCSDYNAGLVNLENSAAV